MLNKKHLLPFFLPLISLSFLFSCDTLESNESGTVKIIYSGIEESQNGSVAAFLLVNDTTETVQFWAYGEEAPLFSTEVLSDTGWTYLMYNWCGTGSSPIELDPGSKTKFTTSLPHYDCTWRVILGISVANSDKYYNVKSNEIEFSIQE